MNRSDQHRDLLEALLGAPGSDDGWTAFLRRTRDVFGGAGASLIAHDFMANDTQIAITAEIDPDAMAAYAAHWHHLDPWAASPLTPRSNAGLVLHGEQMIASSDLRRTAFFNEFGRRYGIVALIGFIEVSPEALSCLSIIAPADDASWPDEDARFLQSLLPSVQRAIGLHRRLESASLGRLQSAAVLDRLAHGVLFLSARGRVLSTNRAADAILRARDGLSLVRGELRAATLAVTQDLRDAVTAAIGRHGDATACARPLLLQRPSLRRPLSVTVAPLPLARRGVVTDGAVAVMVVTDTDLASRVNVDVLRATWQLTPAEARLVGCLAAGMSLSDAARQLDVKIGTARTRLKLIFEKTGTRRQADLVRVALTSAT